LDRPAEYGPHWGGFADRFGIGMAGSVTGMQLKRPRAWSSGRIRAISVRRTSPSELASEMWYGSRLLPGAPTVASNQPMRVIWQFSEVTSSQTPGAFAMKPMQDALLRASNGFAGRMAANAFEEF
jgi:hypothetical protein